MESMQTVRGRGSIQYPEIRMFYWTCLWVLYRIYDINNNKDLCSYVK